MSTYKVRIIFSGLCGFVPRGPEGSDSDPKSVDVLLVKVDNDGSENNGEYGSAPPLHNPLLRFDLRNLVGVDGDKIGAKGFWLLDDEDVTFSLVSVDGSSCREFNRGISMKLDGRRSGSRKPFMDPKIPDPKARLRDYKNQVADFSWLPEVSKVLGEDVGPVNPECLGPNPSYFAGARCHLGEGILVSRDLGTLRSDSIVAQFVPPFREGLECPQALAHRVALEANVEDNFNFVITAVSYDRKKKREVVLQPADMETDDYTEPGIEIRISNLCCGSDLEDEKVPTKSAQASFPAADQDFGYMYPLLKNYEDLKKNYELPLPVPVSYPSSLSVGSEAGGISGIACTGCRFLFYPAQENENESA